MSSEEHHGLKNEPERGGRPRRPAARPLDARRLEELALAYVARFATSTGKLSAYLARKLSERGWDGEGEPGAAVVRIVARHVEAGYLDDAAWARSRSESLQRRGLGRRRIVQDLGQAGVAGATAEQALPDPGAARRAALACARKRGFGPFARRSPGDPVSARAAREKQLAAMLRAGHALDSARELVDAASAEVAEQWAAEFDFGSDGEQA